MQYYSPAIRCFLEETMVSLNKAIGLSERRVTEWHITNNKKFVADDIDDMIKYLNCYLSARKEMYLSFVDNFMANPNSDEVVKEQSPQEQG